MKLKNLEQYYYGNKLKIIYLLRLMPFMNSLKESYSKKIKNKFN